jgi:methionyl-tRNA formyltransferase
MSIPVLELNDMSAKDGMTEWVRLQSPDVIYCIGWSWLIPQTLLDIPRLGVIGFHPAALPQNRGRHPIIWTLALGLDESASTFFLMNAAPDAGDIVSQKRVKVHPEDDAAALYGRILDTMRGQIPVFTAQIRDGTLRTVAQDETRATSWRKRTPEDGRIDWRMPAEGVKNLVRALARPYPGAHFMFRGGQVKVWRVRVVRFSDPYAEPGKVVVADEQSPIVKCGVDAVCLVEHELALRPSKGDYL